MLDLDTTSIDAGWFIAACTSLSAVGLVVGVFSRGPRWWATWGIGIAATITVLVAAASWWIRWSGLVGGHYPASFFL